MFCANIIHSDNQEVFKIKTLNLKNTSRNLHYEIITYKWSENHIQMCKV